MLGVGVGVGVGIGVGVGVGAGMLSMTKLSCLLRLFAFLPPSIILPLFEKDSSAGEAKSSKLPVGIIMSMPWKGNSPVPFDSNEESDD